MNGISCVYLKSLPTETLYKYRWNMTWIVPCIVGNVLSLVSIFTTWVSASYDNIPIVSISPTNFCLDFGTISECVSTKDICSVSYFSEFTFLDCSDVLTIYHLWIVYIVLTFLWTLFVIVRMYVNEDAIRHRKNLRLLLLCIGIGEISCGGIALVLAKAMVVNYIRPGFDVITSHGWNSGLVSIVSSILCFGLLKLSSSKISRRIHRPPSTSDDYFAYS